MVLAINSDISVYIQWLPTAADKNMMKMQMSLITLPSKSKQKINYGKQTSLVKTTQVAKKYHSDAHCNAPY